MYAVVWTNHHDADVSVLAEVAGARPEPELTHDDLRLTPVGRFLVASGPAEACQRYQNWAAAITVHDIADAARRLTRDCAELLAPAHDEQAPGGRRAPIGVPGTHTRRAMVSSYGAGLRST
ncbi:hypothetical protein AB0I53_47845 [Saccharopolyspora sp. NPDC050389]|uniref:hypothetical protein n=1 Tax=Saccharopolyspora sp. NPDC050389 TaxID=3155516 RepID=UPI0033F6C6C4